MTTRRELLEAYPAEYKSPPTRGSVFSRIAPTAAFYAQIAPVVLRSAEYGRYGFFNDACWRDQSGKVLRAFERCGVPVLVENLRVFETLREPCLIIGNHMSTTETFVLAKLLIPFRPITYVVKEALVRYPVFKHIMRARDPVVVGRKDPRADLRAVLEGGAERLARGWTLIIFPQKTRKVEFVPAEFNSIGVKLAKRAGVPIVPLAVKTDAWANGTRFKDFGPFQPDKPVHFAFGEPMRVTGNGREQNEAVMAFIQEKLSTWEQWDAQWRAAKA
ncbi:MAG: lysophospholipid acyltransferase family protein [Verrucomicrobiota bacterium]